MISASGNISLVHWIDPTVHSRKKWQIHRAPFFNVKIFFYQYLPNSGDIYNVDILEEAQEIIEPDPSAEHQVSTYPLFETSLVNDYDD